MSSSSLFDPLAVSISRAALSVALLFAAGCSGQLVIEDPATQTCEASSDCDIGLVCDTSLQQCVESAAACSVGAPEGDCPLGRQCQAGICACVDSERCGCASGDCTVTGGTYCDCEEGESCTNEGVCTAVTDENACGAATPTGLCLDGEVCAGGTCVPVDASNACTPEQPDGLCTAGLVCDRGYCIPAGDFPCAPDRLNGLCPAGQSCSGDGACEVVGCSDQNPFGTCDPGERCVEGSCERLPCSEQHPNGFCDSGFFCAATGTCVREGQCASNDDCEAVEFCSLPPEGVSEDSICVATTACRFDTDCEAIVGQGYACESASCVPRVSCTQDSECLVGSFCSAGQTCRAPGECDADTDCETGEFCSTETNLCTPTGECRVSSDCTGSQVCSRVPDGATCIDPGTCLGDEDCQPGFACDLTDSTCEVNATVCTSNETSSACTGGETVCCPAGETCCPIGQVCSFAGTSDGLCIAQGACRDDADCATGFSCNALFECVPELSNECEDNDDCGTDTTCKPSGVCLATGDCLNSNDCLDNEVCNSAFECEPVSNPACGFDSFALGGILPPNVLIVIDRSNSMNLCGPGQPLDGTCGNPGDDCNCCSSDPSGAAACSAVPGCNASSLCNGPFPTCVGVCEDDSTTCSIDADCVGIGSGVCQNRASATEGTRWEQAVAAVDDILTSQSGQVAFGLSTYPAATGRCSTSTTTECFVDEDCPGSETCENVGFNECTLACNWGSCSDKSGQTGGEVSVPVSLSSSAAIRTALDSIGPGGGTPSGSTLRSIASLSDLGGLDAVDRANAVVLITDGTSTGDTASDIGVCEPVCNDGARGDGETDIDCGGLCPACAVGGRCESDLDCAGDATCPDGTCRAATCSDGTRNGDETATDCGGSCPPCSANESCDGDADCQSGACMNDTCAAATCTDGIQNANETDIDCGGGCSTACAEGLGCLEAGDCDSGVCQDDECRPASCGDGMQNDDETGTDCGGAECGACATTGTCANGVRDGDETDVDCGGSCAACRAGFNCASTDDCATGSCATCPTDNLDPAFNSCRVNAAIDRLYAVNKRIRTFVVGFEFQGVNTELNCYAAHGRTARQDNCPGATPATCTAQTSQCYFTANDTQSLVDAFDVVVDEVTSCIYDVSSAPLTADPELANVYLDRDLGDGADLERLVKLKDWAFRPISRTIEFFGPACDDLLAGNAVPLVVYGCRDFGG